MPPQNLPVVVDTGSWDLVIMSDKCPDCHANGNPIFNTNRSRSFNPLAPHQNKYGFTHGVSTNGTLGTDRVSFISRMVSADHQPFGTCRPQAQLTR